MKIIISLVDEDGDTTRAVKILFDGKTWSCAKGKSTVIEKCPGIDFAEELVSHRAISADGKRSIDNLIYEAERVAKKATIR